MSKKFQSFPLFFDAEIIRIEENLEWVHVGISPNGYDKYPYGSYSDVVHKGSETAFENGGGIPTRKIFLEPLSPVFNKKQEVIEEVRLKKPNPEKNHFEGEVLKVRMNSNRPFQFGYWVGYENPI